MNESWKLLGEGNQAQKSLIEWSHCMKARIGKSVESKSRLVVAGGGSGGGVTAERALDLGVMKAF